MSSISRRFLFLGLLVALLSMSPAWAQAVAPPGGADVRTGEHTDLAAWIGSELEVVDVDAGSNGAVFFAFRVTRTMEPPANTTDEPPTNQTADNDSASGNATDDTNRTMPTFMRFVAEVSLSSDVFTFAVAEPLVVLPTNASAAWFVQNVTFAVAETADGEAMLALSANVFAEYDDGNRTLVDTFSESLRTQVTPIVVPAPPTPFPTAILIGGAAVVAVAAGAGVMALRSRREKAVMNRAPRRSQALREEAIERAVEKARKPDDVAAAQVAVKQELRQQEVVREQRRELQILEAKRADVIKTMDLLKKRLDAGGITKHQYDTMVKKKQVDLDRISEEIAQMEAESDGSAAA